MRTKTLTRVIAGGLALLAAACGGGAGDDTASSASGGGRRVAVAMVDIDFEPETLEVTKGEEVRFVFTNEGKLRHEAYFGSPEDQADHASEMADAGHGSGSGGHDAHGAEPGSDDKVTVEPGKSGEITYRFEEAGTFEIGCHEPGHYAAGMRITVNVS